MAPVQVVRTWLEMRAPPPADTARRPAPPEVTLAREPVTPARYRQLYAAVGRAWHWRDRDAWSDETLAEYLARPDVAVHVLRVGGQDAGYFELRTHDDGSVEIAYLGLAAPFLGRGLGRFLLERAIDAAWAAAPTRVWLHTCTLDHPAALPNYLARGFRPWRQDTYLADVPPPEP